MPSVVHVGNRVRIPVQTAARIAAVVQVELVLRNRL